MPNVVVLMSDEHNPRFASVYGHPFIRTPNMERLAANGTVFENAYCPSPLCMPARAAFFTGRRVHEIQTYNNCTACLGFDLATPRAEPRGETYGSVLADQRVHTVHVGKVHAHNAPERLGFSEMIGGGGFAPVGDTYLGRTPLMVRKDAAERAGRFGPTDDPFRLDLHRMDAALKWLRRRGTTLDRPWTLCVNLDKPHFPHYVTQELWEIYEGRDDLPEHGVDCETARHPYMQDLRKHFQTDRFTGDEIRGQRRGYLGCVTFVDGQLGRILDLLDETRLAEDTDVIYTSDHGEMLGKFGMWWKCTLLEDAAHVPLIAMGPGFARAARIKTPVDLLDVQAAMFRAVGAERPADWHGEPLQEIPADDPGRVVFSEYHGHGTRSGAFMIRKGDWKVIHCMQGPHLLFNLAEDPDELRNLYDTRPEKAAELEGELRALCSPERENERAHAFEKRQLRAVAAATLTTPGRNPSATP